MICRNRYRLFIYLLILTSSYFWSCAVSAPHPSGSKFYKPEMPLTSEVAYSLSTSLKVRIPEGWFTAEDKDCECIDLWLIRNDFSATINLVTIDTPVLKDSLEDEINTMLNISKKKRAEKLANFIQTREDEFFQLNEKKYAAYEFQGDEGLPIRVIVFRYEDQYFELSAMPAAEVGKHPVNLQALFDIQQSVLNSIK